MAEDERSPFPIELKARLSSMNERGFSWSSYKATGASNLRVGGNLNIIGGSAGSSSYSGYSGDSCGSQWSSNTFGVQLGGLILENLWDGEVIVGGDINIRGCDGGDSADSNGGNAIPTGILGATAFPYLPPPFDSRSGQFLTMDDGQWCSKRRRERGCVRFSPRAGRQRRFHHQL
jgi:hypothetical protein